MRIDDLEGKRIAILGAGREGQAAYTWLHAKLPRAELTLVAESPADDAFVAGLHAGDSLFVEPLHADRLRSFDVLIRSPGISPYREALRLARDVGVRITTPSSLWFAAHPAARSICITGTKGKSTTAALVAHMLQACGLEVRLGGNIGLPLLACDDHAVDWWVIELSSYQIADLEAAPTIALILNLSPEHLDWHGSEEIYRRDKLRLADLVMEGRLIVNAFDPGLVNHFADATNVSWFNTTEGLYSIGKQVFRRQELLPVDMPGGLPGRHNLHNTVAALSVANAVGVDLREAAGAVSEFKSLPHRLQSLGQLAGVTYVNDSIATTPVATLAALEALQGQAIILIVGGMDRGIDWSCHADAFLEWPPAAVIGLPANGPQIISVLRQAGFSPPRGYHEAVDLPAAMAKVRELVIDGDTVLLSPGAPSFPQFIDFRDRGQAFARLSGLEVAIE